MKVPVLELSTRLKCKMNIMQRLQNCSSFNFKDQPIAMFHFRKLESIADQQSLTDDIEDIITHMLAFDQVESCFFDSIGVVELIDRSPRFEAIRIVEEFLRPFKD